MPVGETTDACCVEMVSVPPQARSATRTTSTLYPEGAKKAMGAIEPPDGGAVVLLQVAPVVCQNCVDQTTAALADLEGVVHVSVGSDGATRLALESNLDKDAVTAKALAAVTALGKTAAESTDANA